MSTIGHKLQASQLMGFTFVPAHVLCKCVMLDIEIEEQKPFKAVVTCTFALRDKFEPQVLFGQWVLVHFVGDRRHPYMSPVFLGEDQGALRSYAALLLWC